MNVECSPCWPGSVAIVARRSHSRSLGRSLQLKLSSFRGRAVQMKTPHDSKRVWGAFVWVSLLSHSTTGRAQGWCPPRSKRQVGFGKENRGLVSAAATAKCASCCPCAPRRLGIRDPYRPLPSSRQLARSPCGHTTRSRSADAEAGRIPRVGFYGDRNMRHKPFRSADAVLFGAHTDQSRGER